MFIKKVFPIFVLSIKNIYTMEKLAASLENELNILEMKVSMYFSELLKVQKEIIIFDEADLEHDTPDDYLEYRNEITGNVIDVHPLKVDGFGIHVIDADGGIRKRVLRFSDFATIQDRLNICGLMENNLVN